MPIGNSKVIITKHVMERMQQRFPNLFGKYFGNDTMLRNLIIAQVLNGELLEDWKRVPFYKNKLDIEYGPGTEIVRKSGVYYLCQRTSDGKYLRVLTAVPGTLYYPRADTIAVGSPGGARYYNINEYITRLHTEALKEYRLRNEGLAPKQKHAGVSSVAELAEVNAIKQSLKQKIYNTHKKIRKNPRDVVGKIKHEENLAKMQKQLDEIEKRGKVVT